MTVKTTNPPPACGVTTPTIAVAVATKTTRPDLADATSETTSAITATAETRVSAGATARMIVIVIAAGATARVIVVAAMTAVIAVTRQTTHRRTTRLPGQSQPALPRSGRWNLMAIRRVRHRQRRPFRTQSWHRFRRQRTQASYCQAPLWRSPIVTRTQPTRKRSVASWLAIITATWAHRRRGRGCS